MPVRPQSRLTKIVAIAIVATLGGALVIVAALSIVGGNEPATRGLAPRFTDITETFRSETEALRREESAAPPVEEPALAEVLRVYSGLRDATAKARDGYRRLEVPKDMAAARDRLVGLLDQRVGTLRGIIEAAEVGDQATAAEGVRDLVTSAAGVATAQQALAEQIAACGSRCD